MCIIIVIIGFFLNECFDEDELPRRSVGFMHMYFIWFP